MRLPIDSLNRGDTLGFRLGVASGLNLGTTSGLSRGVASGLKRGTTFGLSRGTAFGLKRGTTSGFRRGTALGLSRGDDCGLNCGVVCGVVCERASLKGGNRLIVTGLRGALTLGVLGVAGVRTVGRWIEKLLRRFGVGVRLICGDRSGLIRRGVLIDGRGVERRGIARDGLLMLGRLSEGRGVEIRGAGAEGRLGAGRDAALLAALWDGCACKDRASSKAAATAAAIATALKDVLFLCEYIVKSPFPGGSPLQRSGTPIPASPSAYRRLHQATNAQAASSHAVNAPAP
ncbi:MAG: hypothetical protein JW993_19675 [Sedimentisphaerales bacterium]|nr:hypothetical protein [Sedimentisphaerales bacterium]